MQLIECERFIRTFEILLKNTLHTKIFVAKQISKNVLFSQVILGSLVHKVMLYMQAKRMFIWLLRYSLHIVQMIIAITFKQLIIVCLCM